MKNAWKWILGILIVLLIFFAPLLHRAAFDALGYETPAYGMMRGFGGPMMGGRGGFGGHGFGGGLIPLVVIGLIGYGIYWFVTKKRAAPVAMKACTSCGKFVQEDWKNCPYCGNAL